MNSVKLVETKGTKAPLGVWGTSICIHSQRRHEQGVAHTLVAKNFMWIIGNHSNEDNKNNRHGKPPVSIFAS